jgi:hypothetical protein
MRCNAWCVQAAAGGKLFNAAAYACRARAATLFHHDAEKQY